MTDPVNPASPVDLVRDFWATLARRDWEAVAAFFDDRSEYWDVPIGRENGATGAANIVARLRLGLEPLASYDNHDERHIASGGDVVTLHHESWRWDDDHAYELSFSTYQRIDGDVIVEWRDYSDMSGLMAAAPAWWHERLATADLSFRTGP